MAHSSASAAESCGPSNARMPRSSSQRAPSQRRAAGKEAERGADIARTANGPVTDAALMLGL